MTEAQPALWIDGEWIVGSEPAFAILNPATGKTIANLPLAGKRDFTRAIDGAARAFELWRKQPNAYRGEILKRISAQLLAQRERLSRILSSEQGKPLPQAVAEVDYAASFFQWYGEEARRLCGRIQSHPQQGREYQIRMTPVGVVGLVTPWNFPLAQGAKKLAAALAAGCTAVWKPSEETPLVALALGPLCEEAGLPKGVLQIVPALGPLAGEALTADARIRVISLTGSTRTGRTLMRDASAHFPRLALELGGNAPFIVLPNADLDRAAADLVKLKLLCSGQVCVTANRIFVPSILEDDFIGKLSPLCASLRLGDGLLAGNDAGPLIHRQACARVGALVEDARRAGAELVSENRSYERESEGLAGSFYPATLLRGVRDEMTIAQEEIFGPVLPIFTFTEVSEAVRRANASPYGLAAYVYGNDLDLANRVANALDVGIVGVNEWRPLRAEIPFGGIKESGLGHEGGEEGIREFTSPKVIAIDSPFNV